MAGSASELTRSRLPMVVGRWLLAVVVVGAALTAVTSSVVYARASEVKPGLFGLIMAIVAVAAVRYARIPTRVGQDVVMLVWAELALVIVLCLVPVAWVSVACAAGAVLGHAHRFRVGGREMRVRVGYAMANSTTAAASAAGVVAAVHAQMGGADLDFSPVRVDLGRPESFLPLVFGVIMYALVQSALTAVWLGLDHPARLPDIWKRLIVGKGHLVFGTVVASFAVSVAIAVDPRWLLALAPVLLALHRAYAYHLRSIAERGTWVTLAGATGELHQADEQAVARAAVRGAVELFGPDDVELVLEQPIGRLRYVSGGELPARRIAEPGSLNALSAHTMLPRRGTPWVVARRLAVGGTQLGEIRLSFPQRGALTAADQHAFSTFADSVASALHDAATSRHLRTVTAQTAFEAVHDPLTALFNRSTLVALGNAHLCQAAPGPVVAFILLDLDKFQEVNDSLGMTAGDEVLQLLGQRLAGHGRPGEILGRAGADEFGVLLTDPTLRGGSVPGAERGWTYPSERARDLCALLAEPVVVRPGVSIVVEASAGIAVEAAGGSDMSELLRRAELAVHQAKRLPGRIYRYDPVPGCGATDRLTLLAEFRDALSATDQLVLEIQPTVDLETGIPVSAEALVRWCHPRLGQLAPRDFMGVIEPTELSANLTAHVLGLAVAVAADWAAQGLRLPISVNLSTRCIVDPSLPARLADLLALHGLSPELLILEITESVTAHADVVTPVMAELRAAGVTISVDDFGTGSASLQFLTKFSVDEVKIDRRTVAAMADSAETAAIVRTMIDLARRLDLRVVAEGVETEQQCAMLRDLGVTAGQGFLLQPPRPVPETTMVLLDLAAPSPSAP
jgi:diguanylate cyclase (GGDEF)-like protein